MKKIFLLTLVIFFSRVGVSCALIEAGTKEVGGAASLSFTEDYTFYMGMGTFGYFVSPEIGLNFNLAIMGSPEEDGGKIITPLGQIRYYFYKKGQTIIPYLGGQIGFRFYEEKTVTESWEGDGTYEKETEKKTDTKFCSGGMGGIKFFLNEDVSVNLEANYQTDGTGIFQLLAGISYFFGN
ncbi:MAG: hypothetical protein AB1847_10355 [bacterium]